MKLNFEKNKLIEFTPELSEAEVKASKIYNCELMKIIGPAQKGAFKKGFVADFNTPNPYTRDKWAFYSAFYKGRACKKKAGYNEIKIF